MQAEGGASVVANDEEESLDIYNFDVSRLASNEVALSVCVVPYKFLPRVLADNRMQNIRQRERTR